MADPLLCPECKKQVIFDSDVFGSICSQCGLVLDGTDLLVSSSTFPTDNTTASTSYSAGVNSSKSLTWIQREAKKLLKTADERNGPHILPPYVTAVTSAILSHFESINLLRQCADLYAQVKVLSKALHDEYQLQKSRGAIILPQAKVRQQRNKNTNPNEHEEIAISEVTLLHGEETDIKVAIACTFSVLKRYNDAITLEAVSRAAGAYSSSNVADTLRYIESLFGGTHMLKISRDDPSMHLTGHIALLCDPSHNTFLEAQESSLIKAANITSLSFLDLVMDLCSLCAMNGLNNRSAKLSSRKDLGICAWALLMIAVESASGKLCREGKMAESMNLLSDPQSSKETDLLSGKTTVSELIKKRYVEISRMVTCYMQHLPWISEVHSANGSVKVAKKGKGRASVSQAKADLTSIKPLPRKIISRYLKDVLILRRHIEVQMKAKGTFSVHEGWARFGSTEDLFHRIRASTEGRKMIKQEEEEAQLHLIRNGSGEAEHDHPEHSSSRKAYEAALSLFADDSKDQSREGTSDLALAIGPILLKEEALQTMSNDVVDSLLFTEGEMNSYMRSEEEMEMLQKLRVEGGDWDAALTDPTRKRSRSSSQIDLDESFRKANGKRTKARSEEEASRILSLL